MKTLHQGGYDMADKTPALRSQTNEPVVPGTIIGRSRHAAGGVDAALTPQRCLTCKATLPAGVERYCNDACFLKMGRSKRSPGRTAARRRRRRGGRKR